MNAIEQLLKIMADLREPDTGCPWDIKQSFETIVPYTLEEAYEVADAIEQGNMDELKSELGDLLFQIVFYAQMAKEQKLFDFTDVVSAINEKLLRRHPHVFADSNCKDEQALSEAWEQSKATERETQSQQSLSALAGVAAALPALKRAQKLQKRAARTGFDWADIEPVFKKIEEEIAEVRAAIAESDSQHIEEEMGDLLFSCVNLSRHLDVDGEDALRKSNQKFIRRFEFIESRLLTEGRQINELALEELEKLWHEAKNVEKCNVSECK